MEMLLLLFLFVGDNGGLDGDVAGDVAGDLNKKSFYLCRRKTFTVYQTRDTEKKVKKLKIVKIEYSPLINKQVEIVPLLYINFLDNENFVRHFLLDNV